VDFKETAIALDPNHEASIFAKGADGKATEEDIDLYVEILKLTMTETSKCLIEVKSLWTNLLLKLSLSFSNLSKDVRKVVVPEWGPL
jgi:hypothetical protein